MENRKKKKYFLLKIKMISAVKGDLKRPALAQSGFGAAAAAGRCGREQNSGHEASGTKLGHIFARTNFSDSAGSMRKGGRKKKERKKKMRKKKRIVPALSEEVKKVAC